MVKHMKITKIHVVKFGALTNYVFLPQAGLNIIYAPNENGKSTLLDFVRYMFYGASQRKKSDGLTFKEKYMPWDGYEISGNIEFSVDGKSYLLSRSEKIGTAEKKCNLFDVGSGREIVLEGEPGLFFFEFDDKTFFNTFFVSDVRSISSGNSGHELMAVVSGKGINDSAYPEIKKSLSEHLLKLSSTKRASSEVNITDSLIKQQKDKIYALASRKINLKKECESVELLSAEIEELEAYRIRIATEKMSRRICELKKLRAEKQSQLKTLTEEADDGVISFVQATETENEIMREDMSGMVFRICIIVLFAFIFAFGACVSYLMMPDNIFKNICTLFFVVLTFAVCISAFVYGYKLNLKKKIKFKIFDKFGVKTYNEYISKLAGYESVLKRNFDISEQISNLKKIIASIDKQIEDICDTRKTTDMSAENFVETNSFTNDDLDDIILKTDERIRQLRLRYDAMILRVEQISEIDVMISAETERYNILLEKRAALQKRIRIYEYALEILDSAFEELKNNISPLIFARAYEIFSDVVGDKYVSIVADEKFSAHLLTPFGYKTASHLSKGTRDMLDISLRIAVSEIISAKNNPIPVFMDDPFCSFDDNRCKVMLDTLFRLSQTRQIFLATCLGREGKYYIDNSDVNTVFI